MSTQKSSKWSKRFDASITEQEYKDDRFVIGGLIAFSLIIVQAFIATGLTDPASYISVFSFAIAIPILALYAWLYRGVVSSTSLALPLSTIITLLVGALADIIGIAAALWHISTFACYFFLLSGCIATLILGVHTNKVKEAQKNSLSNQE